MPAVTRLATHPAWRWGVPIGLVVATLAAARASRARPERRLAAFAGLAAIAVAAAWFSIWGASRVWGPGVAPE